MKLILSFVFSVTFSISYSHPMGISFDEMMEKSETIVIAEFLGQAEKITSDSLDYFSYLGNYLLKVKTVLKGQVKTEIIEVGRAHGQIWLTKNKYYVAFINEDNQFEWYGRVSDDGYYTDEHKKSLENELLHIEGFYDFNAYLVYPANHTVLDLINYIERGYIENTVSGYIHFYDTESNSMQPSDMFISATYYYSADSSFAKVEDRGIELSDFITDSAQVFLTSWDETIEIDYESNLVRPFTIIGELSKNPNSTELSAMFWVEAPEELDESNLKNYLKNPALGPPIYSVDIEITGLENCSLTLSQDFPSVVLRINEETWSYSSFSSPSNDDFGYIKFDNETKITLDKLDSESAIQEYTRERMIRALRRQDLGGTIVFSEKSGFATYSGKLIFKLAKTSFMENPNFEK